jgi:L-alanine-DL-glutamate epimerase-like enolase superfamily enzyme
MRHREFALCAITSEDGVCGHSYCYSRDAPIAAYVRRIIGPMYVGEGCGDPGALFWRAAWSNNAALAAGAGHRALSLVDLAAWDLAGKVRGESLAAMLGGVPQPMNATAIVGYPPSLGGAEVESQVRELYGVGWRRFKLPIAGSTELTLERLRAARAAAPDAWLGMDANWVFRTSAEVATFSRLVADLSLGWIEDIVPPGDAHLVAECRQASAVPIAMGDEQGGSYHPEALLQAHAVDVVRIDVSTNGGITRLPQIVERLRAAGASFSCHMFPHYHAQAFAALGELDMPIEWGARDTGIDQYTDALPPPTIVDGRAVVDDQPGIGPVVSRAWVEAQVVDDPDGLVETLDG